ncbi:hypothetical protein CO172_02480 [Candidatus Uhrbacteria bacterium CG_4_9_14_3_um_filter_36_7]|uniref:UDP-N-acetylmuramoyl-L-alanyl-D-glutamate--2, 6-diaminopimelate ligase n=1 Tax=Candidatus Uhrbacteria bacterium CG_4_9_14_3_um_filter_36_7 TaxID=1975033 RepID=A0A2M7XHA9_9BACT|nr:MAG: hypothetical protein CO172_02480 [Candidatus Uhrbacteria bacterium CG_4_9_14_3_um_filter_36_7]
MLKSLLKKVAPAFIIPVYHKWIAMIAPIVYRFPSEKMVVIGITGTNGKSSTVQLLGRLLERMGYKVGWTSTAGFKIGEKEWINDQKMTMLGRFQTQKFLSQMVRDGCQYAIIETSSQGVVQSRHLGIHYDIAVWTNLTPEHIEAHGGFEAYKQAKGRFFEHVAKGKPKYLNGKKQEKSFIVNLDDPHAPYFFECSKNSGKKFGFGFEGKSNQIDQTDVFTYKASEIVFLPQETVFTLQGQTISTKLVGSFQLYNILAATVAALALGIDKKFLFEQIPFLEPLPGRLEFISEGQNFLVVVDYAYEPYAIQALYETLKLFNKRRIIHVFGSAGGGRDKARRKILGVKAAQDDDIVIITNDDPYDEDPIAIIQEIADAARVSGKKEGENLFCITNRQQAIKKAVELAQEGDLVLLTGKGNEPVMAISKGKKIPSDDRAMVRACLWERLKIQEHE